MTFDITPTPGAILGRTTLNLSRTAAYSLDPIDQVINAVCETFRISKHDLLEKTRQQHVAWPRQIAMALASETGDFGLRYIGERFGMKDHGTVLHAKQRVQDRCDTDKRSREQVERVKGMLA